MSRTTHDHWTMSDVLARLPTLLPIEDQELFDLYDKARRTFWTEDEIDLKNDVVQWKTDLNDDERHFLIHVLGFFVQSDQIVNINLSDRFLNDIEAIPDRYCKYARLFYNFQMAIEDIHTLSYEQMINEFVTDASENKYFKQSIANIPAVAKKADWAARFITDSDKDYPHRLIAFAILEGIFFSGSFCAIFWIEQKNLLRGLSQYNKFISHDERLHHDFALCLFRKLRDDPSVEFNCSKDTIVAMVKEAVEIECEFINVSISCEMIGMSTEKMSAYIKFVSDGLLADIDIPPVYNAENPFPFMAPLGMVDKSNFFEQRETVYSKARDSGIEYDSDASDF